jgi:hypothetical protein
MLRRLLLVPVLAVASASCASSGAGAPSASEQAARYTEQMEQACAVTATALDALPEPTGATMADFASQAAAVIADEAERLRVIEPPDDAAADHRAFIANTDRQAASWGEVAGTEATDTAELDRLVEEIGQLTLGRDELAHEMGLDGCRRAP